ncbi:DUF5709 domain-containing protein [Jatrophihabitans sp.]|uniref:DUF5709 domain-containing protein n=1 Tax=Jatrophihabitans sp. TaxID=1932789 RepID=UPI0030C758A0|nr:hypothetical protein [Jatrophihabitans sp.]
MSESDDLYVSGYTDENQLDPSDTLTGDDTQDPLDAGYTVPDRASHSWRGETPNEALAGESLDDHLAEEEPEVWDETEDVEGEERAGRLVSPDEGAHASVEGELHASDAGRAGYAASAEEAAVYIVDEDRPV